MQIDMYKNFLEEITELEKTTILPLLIDCLAFKTKEQMVTSKHLAGYLKACHLPSSDARVRKLLAYASAAGIKQGREEHLGDKVIVACSSGYFTTDNPEDVEDLLDDLDRRRKNLDFRIEGVRAQLLNLKHRRTA